MCLSVAFLRVPVPVFPVLLVLVVPVVVFPVLLVHVVLVPAAPAPAPVVPQRETWFYGSITLNSCQRGAIAERIGCAVSW